ncbi:hypothetical protein CK203_044732 [Vitis vinifera]|uniref:Retrovirus-related Pol polyprotein from transposon RE1 n=1 Tax=Vitis vinifera TaxID=29760 RepID=A0A438H9T5_VITVI|nr:hypothetical protein CK203_044732 [Vitis vinifera]
MTFGHNSWRCILSNGKNFPTFKCTHCNKTGHTKSRCFEIMGYPDWWDHNHDQRKKDSKKTSTGAVAEIKTEANVAEKAFALVAATDYGVVPSLDYNLLSISQITAALSCIVILWPEFCVIKDIQTRQMIGCGIKRGKLYYLELQSKDSNKLRQALMVDGSEGRRKSLKFGCGIDVWDMLPLGEYQKEIQTLDYDYHIFEEDESGQSELMKSLQKNETCELVECPSGKKPIGCHWIYTVNYKADGSIEQFKARLVAKGMHGVRKAMSEGVQIEEVIVWVEAIPESMVWKETGMSGYQPVDTPIEEAYTRPDLAYALSVVSQYMHNPGEQHMNAVMCILRRSTSGYFTFVGGNLVTWKSKKQNIVACSSAEAEFRGMALGLCEPLWLRLLL